jgi:hypothetical protein
MRTLLLALLCHFAVMPSVARDIPADQTLNAIVTIQLDGLDDALWTKVNARIAKEPHTNVEYACLTTGIIVLRMQQLTVSEKADVMALVRRLLSDSGVKSRVEFLDVHVEPGSGNRC